MQPIKRKMAWIYWKDRQKFISPDIVYYKYKCLSYPTWERLKKGILLIQVPFLKYDPLIKKIDWQHKASGKPLNDYKFIYLKVNLVGLFRTKQNIFLAKFWCGCFADCYLKMWRWMTAMRVSSESIFLIYNLGDFKISLFHIRMSNGIVLRKQTA